MSRREPTDLAASVRDRLLRHSRQRHEDFQRVLMRFGIERWLFRLSKSTHAGTFVLKGAMLLALWTRHPYRPTRDLDLWAGRGLPAERFVADLRVFLLPLLGAAARDEPFDAAWEPGGPWRPSAG